MSGPEKKKYGYRPTPQLSANQIAEYVAAKSPTARVNIIRAARFPKTSIVAQYGKAREGIVAYLGDNTRSASHLAKTADYLAKREVKPGASAWLVNDSRLSQDALAAFQGAYNKLGLSKLQCHAVHGKLAPLMFGHTRISVSIDLITKVPNMAGKDRIGGAVLLFSRGEKSTKARIERSKTVAGLIYTYCGKFYSGLGDVDRSLCFAVDIFESTAHRPPGSFVRQLRQIEDACEEIAIRWHSVKAPSDYDGPDY